MIVDLSPAVAAGVLTAGQANAISGAIVDHGGAVELRRENLCDDEREALDRLVVWMEHAGDCGR